MYFERRQQEHLIEKTGDCFGRFGQQFLSRILLHFDFSFVI